MAGLAAMVPPDQEVAVGLVGPHELLERIVLAAGLPGGPGRTQQSLQDDSGRGLRRRLLMAAYRNEQDAPDKVSRLGAAVDACLFASPVPLELARRAAVLRRPAVSIDLADGPLLATLLYAARSRADVSRLSFDTFGRPEVEEGLAQLGVPAAEVHVREEIAGPAALASYHARLWRIGQTAGAVTCLDEVARRLTASQVPVFQVQPTEQSIVSALQIATLLAGRRALADAQLAVAVVEVPALRAAARRAPRHVREHLRLRVHAFLISEAQRIGAAVSPIGEHGFLVVATCGPLIAGLAGDPPFAARAQAALGVAVQVGVATGRTEQEAEDRARRLLGKAHSAADSRTRITLAAQPDAPGAVGVPKQSTAGGPVPAGTPVILARTTAAGAQAAGSSPVRGGQAPDGIPVAGRQAPDGAPATGGHAAASTPLAGGRGADGAPVTGGRTTGGTPLTGGRAAAVRAAAASAAAVGSTAAVAGIAAAGGAEPGGPAAPRQVAESLTRLRNLETLARLAQKLAADATPVVDAELTGRLLSVTPRTARRQLRALADQGLALPLPPGRTRHPGRPRQSYRLVVEKLDRRAAR